MIRFILADRVNGSERFANGSVVSTLFENVPPTTEKFLISQSASTQPEPLDIRFQNQPNYLTVNTFPGQTATVYLWTKNFIDQVDTVPQIATISILPLEPTASVELIGIIDSSAKLKRDRAKVAIIPSLATVKFAVSESQTFQPELLSTTIPHSIDFAGIATYHTAYVWLEDINHRRNSAPIIRSFYSPPDTQLSHNPGLAFVDATNQGLTENTTTIKAVNAYGDYILWNEVGFNPLGKNFSDVAIERICSPCIEYRITVPSNSLTDADLLATSDNWTNVIVHIENKFQNPTIIQNDRVIYSHGEVLVLPAINYINVTKTFIEFSPNHFDTIRVTEYSADVNNEIVLQIDDYDFCFLDSILHASPSISADIGSTTDETLNPMLAASMNVTIEINLAKKELTFLDQFNQAEFVFSGREVNRMRDFSFTSNYIIDTRYDTEPLFSLTATVCVQETAIEIIDPEFSTSTSVPPLSFFVHNPPNTFAEFTIQIDDTPDFSTPQYLAFRIKETDGRILTLETLNKHEIIFFDSSLPPFQYGTFYWRVRRNQSDWTSPASVTIRSAPVVRLEFTLDSEFIKEIGQIAKIKVKAIDASSEEVIGAKIDFDVPHLNFNSTSNTNYAGIAPTNITMPVTVQDFLVSAESEGITISHLMTAVDSTHMVSEITFNRIPDPPMPPPVMRYLIFRKLLAEVRDETEDVPLQIDQLPNSPVVRFDRKLAQPNVVFDPLNMGINQAIDIVEPKKVDRNDPIEISNIDCNLKIDWEETEERGTTWHYDGKSVSNQNVRSDRFADIACEGRKFDIITAFLANNKTISPSPYPTHGVTFPPYIVERIDPNYSVPVTIAATQNSAIDNNWSRGFNTKPNPVMSLTATYSLGTVQLNWINPTVMTHELTKEIVYRVKAYDIAGNHSFSQIRKAPEILSQCIDSTVVTRVNSTECFEEIKECNSLDCDILLAHGSILASSLKVTRVKQCLTLTEGSDYSLTDIGDEMAGIRGKIRFHTAGLIDVHDRISIFYRYAKSIDCDGAAALSDFPIVGEQCNEGFLGPLTNESREDKVKVTEPIAYTYGVWVRSKNGEYSDGRFVQILIN